MSECEQVQNSRFAGLQHAVSLQIMITFKTITTDELLSYLQLNNPATAKQRKAAYERAQGSVQKYSRIEISSGSEQKLSFITSEVIPHQTPCVIEIEVQPNAQLNLTYFENRPTSEHSLVVLKITLHENASLKLLSAFTGSASSSLFLEITHAGQGAISEQKTIFFADKKQQVDIFSTTILDAPNTTTNIIAKGVLNHEAQARFDGAINITPRGNGAAGHLHEHTLLLSPLARVNAIPALKIEHNNVQASHSASVTRVDDDHLFYCGARGIDEQTATRLIVDGFLGEMYRETSLAQELEPLISDKIAQLAEKPVHT